MVLSVFAAHAAAAAPSPEAEAARVGETWAYLKYEQGDAPARLAQVRALGQEATALSQAFPTTATFLYWRAQVLCLEAELMYSIESLDRMREARDLLDKAAELDPKSSLIKSLLGSFYYEVPGWPLSYGSGKKAERYLREALALDPDGMDANFFMGDFLLSAGHAAEAMPYLEKAATASDRLPPSRVVAGRRGEIVEAIAKVRKRLAR